MAAKQPLFVDSHAHLDGGRFSDDLDEVVQRAADNGVTTIVTIGCDLASSRASVELSERYAGVYAAVGVHPHDAGEIDDAAIEQLHALAQHPKVVAIGEIGLDYYRDRCPRQQQQLAFRRQIHLAQQCALPIVVHDRDAHSDVMAILRAENASACGGVLHCFSGDETMARQCIDLGFMLSFTGTITYPKNDAIRAVIAALPIEKMLIETDCPYLAAQPWRGKRNEPAYVVETAKTLADIKQLSVADVARITSGNARRLFNLDGDDNRGRIAYQIRDSLYLNITNRCTNRCVFCAKFRDFTVKGHQLKLDHEPDFTEIITAIGDPTPYAEVVFCGYGEPLLRLDVVKQVAAWLKQRGVKVRINSDGQANLVHKRDILPELAGLVDEISISLNAPDSGNYQRICQSAYGEQAFAAVTDFIRRATRHIPKVVATAVTVDGIDIERCRRLADELGVEFRQRIYNEVG